METGFSCKFLLIPGFCFPKININWLIITPQFEIDIAHFFSIFMSERVSVHIQAEENDIRKKVGQICKITIDVVNDFEASKKNGFTLNPAANKKGIFNKYS